MNKKEVKIVSLFEIILIVISSFSFAYIVSESNSLVDNLPVKNSESKFISFVREKALNFLSAGIVSAQSSGMQTCLLDNNGASCQEYPSSVCEAQCSSACFPGRRSDFAPCQLGTCYDSNRGLCNSGTPRAGCESSGGTWSAEIPAQCNRECCLIGPDGSGGANQARLSTASECRSLGNSLGAPVSWEPVSGELECIAKVRTLKEGACVLDLDVEFNEHECKFTTQTDCMTSGGTFYAERLCTNPALNTKCEKTENTKCFNGKDGVYYLDSCGNRANIYDSSKKDDENYWSAVVPVSRSCTLESNSNILSNQQNCGNCNYLAGSVCGTIRQGVDRNPTLGQYVCRDLSCVKEDNTRVKHGQSWCAFDSAIGVDGENGTNSERSVDVPGSRHYKKLCFDGEIRTEPCAEYRNGLCVESEPSENGFTTASCRVNTGVLCLSQNENAEKLAKCEESVDCFLKHVEIDKFKFDMCVPKYPAGFELQDEPQEDSKLICGYATNTCTYYEKKGIDGRWSCKINCACKSAEFVETMNNLCMSLGDCGGKVNLAGKFSKNYIVTGDSRDSKATQEYINGLKKYATPVRGQRVDSLSGAELVTLFGLDGSAFDEPDKIHSTVASFGLGAAGMYWASTIYNIGFSSGLFVPLGHFQAFSNVATGAAVGAGIGYIIGMALGLEGDKLTTVVIIGAVVVATLSYAYVGFAAFATNPITLIIVVAIIIILKVTGVGEYRQKTVKFECLPWQAPTGGNDCDKCGANGLGCTEYKCKSYGKTCGFLNKGSDHEICVNIAPNDASAPEISFNPSALSNGFSSDISALGVEIKSSASDGCLKEYSPVTFGISLNEAGQCKFSTERVADYETMEDFFGGSNFYQINHTTTVAMPTLDSLDVSGIDPARRGEYNLYIRCQDGSGHSNDREYVASFCVAPNNDVQSPIIDKFVPESPGVAGINADSFNLQFYTNEPATCRYSLTDTGYELMENEASCLNGINQPTLYGWACLAQLNVSSISNTGNYYFKCADQPWLGSELTSSALSTNPRRNIATESKEYEIIKTTAPLSISSTTLNGTTIYTSSPIVSATLEVSTVGGIDSGKAFCSYSLNNGRFVDFRDTSLSTHKQIWTSMFAGNHNVDLRCVDRAGNVATGNVQFSVVLDNTGPLITRVYNSGSSLKVITNEDSTCAYSTSSCSFDFLNGTIITGAGQAHTMSYNNGLTYKIKCQDSFENVGTCLSVTGGY